MSLLEGVLVEVKKILVDMDQMWLARVHETGQRRVEEGGGRVRGNLHERLHIAFCCEF